MASEILTDSIIFCYSYHIAKTQIMVKESIKKEGIVIETLPSTTFKVKLEGGSEIIAHLAGKLRLHYIRILPGDKVIVEISPYDETRGRIIRRL